MEATKQQTNFKMVTEFNNVLGQGVKEQLTIPSLAQTNLRVNLIKEEAISELIDAIIARDFVAIADAIGDGLVVLYGAANDVGMDADAIMSVIHKSNMSKLCSCEEDAIESVRRYQTGDGFHGKTEPINAGYRPAPHKEGYFVIYNIDTNKTLKGIDFKEPTEGLEKLLFPNGKPAEKHLETRLAALGKYQEGTMTAEQYWELNNTLDAL